VVHWLVLWSLLLGTGSAASAQKAQDNRSTSKESAAASQPAGRDEQTADGEPDETAEAQEEIVTRERTELNLLGEVDTEGGEARRNENVRLTLIDNNVLKELNQRMGATATVIHQFQVDRRYFGKEFGGRPDEPLHVAPRPGAGFHGDFFWSHENSVFNARSFFQVGGVQPARTNDYGLTTGFPGWRGAHWTLEASQRKLRGQVNGNVLVPAADERTPLTTDPDDRKIVEAILGAYPAELPNRTDINPRALNTNAPQNINNDRLAATLDQSLGPQDRLVVRYQFMLQRVEAFQLVGGQNPDTTTRNHRARITWTRSWSAMTTSDLSAGFDRIGSLLVPEETSLGTFYLFSRELESIGPGGNIPIDRAQNLFRYAGRLRQIRGNHTLTAGFEILRRQINGFESNEHRGLFSFRRDFGRDTVDNLRMGTPSAYLVAIGNVHRGFRNWAAQLYLGDQWRASPKLTLSLGLRFEPSTRPTEVNELSHIPYRSDWNNLGPSFGFAWRLPPGWGTIRAAYSIQYGEIFPATFMQSRFNPPGNITISVRAPKLSDPLRDFRPEDLDPHARSSVFRLARDLRTPYEHLYSFSWEFELPRGWRLDLGYVGSRAHKLLATWHLNRARPVPGIPQITRTVNLRRPDKRYYTIYYIHNGSRGYFDAAKVTLQIPRWRGWSIDWSYWFSKALDIGSDYTNTASGRDSRIARSPSEFAYQAEMKGLSRFDQPHAMRLRFNYEAPAPAANGWLRAALGGWQVSAVVLAKSGTPFGVRAGSDAPGWGNVDGESSDNPILLDPSILGRSIDDPDTSTARLPRSAFATIKPTDPRGNLGRNTFRKDGIANINAGISRRWNLKGESSLLFRAESLNLLNHPQFAEPGRSLSSRNFGVITNTLNDGRAFRFTLQLGF